MPTGFFGLPRELRDRIYNYLWHASDLPPGRKKRHWPVEMTLVYTGDIVAPHFHSVSPRLLAMHWLTTNKAMLREGQEQFYRRGYVHVHFTRHADQNTFNIQETPRFLSPCVARDLFLTLWAEIDYAEDESGKQFVSIEAGVLKQVKSMITGNEHLRKLHIRVNIEGLAKENEHDLLLKELLSPIAAVSDIVYTSRLVLTNAPAPHWNTMGRGRQLFS